ncbi:MAG: caspase family protein [Burkholderiaceae bacterium]
MATPTFQRIDIDTFGSLLRHFQFTRQITSVHVHHTWRPARKDFRGHETIVAMWRYHTQTNGWRDIGQHLTLDPSGFLWLGRNWNLPPCSAPTANGTSASGPLMVEVVGDFDENCDVLDGVQRASLAQLIALTCRRFALAPDTLRFHNELGSHKTCPGTSVDRAQLIADVAQALRNLPAEPPATRSFDIDAAIDPVLEPLLRSMERPVPAADDPVDAEPDEDDAQRRGFGDAAVPDARAFGGEGPPDDDAATRGGSGLSPSELSLLRPYLVNLSAGRLSVGGEVTTTTADLDELFLHRLPAAAEEAHGEGRPLKLMIYAHGGLVGEADGLRTAHKHVAWWLRQKVQPIYFVWETGFFEILRQIIGGAKPRGLTDWTDSLIESASRGAPRLIWTGMKTNAQRGVDAPTTQDPAGGAALLVAQRLVEFVRSQAAQQREVELHAVGHSAGSIFHAWFIPAAHSLGLPPFKTVQLLAPAIRCDLFKQRMLTGGALASHTERLTIYTMKRDYELRDTCMRLYRKSLLYLIHHALEPERGAAILGLDESISADPELRAALGLTQPSDRVQVVWSPTRADTGNAASTSITHGGFDDDPPTMTSVLRRVLGVTDDVAVEIYRESRRARAARGEEEDGMITPAARPPAWIDKPAPPPKSAITTSATATIVTAPPAAGGRLRRALCIGIDAYTRPEHRLSGCVADARAWADALQRMGFETTVMSDREATRAGMIDAMRRMMQGSGAGDVLFWHYSGHGTQVPDLDGDETPEFGQEPKDQALVPYDYEEGHLLLDDDIRTLLSEVPAGVNMTVMMDCCHSFTNTRVIAPRPAGARARWFKADAALIEAHRRAFMADPARREASRSVATTISRQSIVKFAACKDTEEALELNGQGQFTLRALDVLSRGIDGLSNLQFIDAVTRAFGSTPIQHPGLDEQALGDPDRKYAPLLQPLPATRLQTSSSQLPERTSGSTSSDELAWAALASLARAAEALAKRPQR